MSQWWEKLVSEVETETHKTHNKRKGKVKLNHD